MKHVADYFARLSKGFGRGWDRFWFTPSDPVTLSAVRLLTGLVVVYLHATLAFDLIAFFGPQGLLPAADIAPLEGNTLSYLNYVHSPLELWIVHLLGLAVLVLFTAGVFTRASSIGALIVFLSDVNRAPMITGRTEVVVAMLLLYLCLGPSGRRFSVDAFMRARKGPLLRETPPLSTAATVATRLIQVHLALLVAMMGFSQLAGDVWWSGLGLWFLVTRESRLVDFTWLHASPKVLDFWAHVVVLYEFAFAVLIWAPLARPILLALGVAVWTSLALVTGDITFALVMCIASVAFVSPALLNQLTDRFGRTSPAPAHPAPAKS
ncbi:MAG: hypothetical protein DWQ37_12490 [Planctomycetota bacterium]|nr:MAG: hypothetical protein DWQ37_12490 [Planctomycetota bacterium]